MRIETNATDRKALANKISELIHEPVHYNGVPSCSYSVGPVTVERTAAITCEDSEAWQRLLPFFREQGWIQEPVDEPADVEETETMETVTMNTEMQTPEATGVNIPLNDFTAIGVANLLRLLYTRQDLINAMTRSDRLCIDEEVMNLLENKPGLFVSVRTQFRHDLALYARYKEGTAHRAG